MFGIGTGELLLLLLIALIVLGPERLPGLARDVGRAMGDLRKTSDELTAEFLRADQAATTTAPPPALAETSAPETMASTAPPLPEGEQPTLFDQEAQRKADELQQKLLGAEAAEPPSESAPHDEAERQG